MFYIFMFKTNKPIKVARIQKLAIEWRTCDGNGK